MSADKAATPVQAMMHEPDRVRRDNLWSVVCPDQTFIFPVRPFLRISIKIVLYDDTIFSMTAFNDWQGLVTQGKR
jgi:hypothetical protein